jgi:hypothetical protein
MTYVDASSVIFVAADGLNGHMGFLLMHVSAATKKLVTHTYDI